MLDGVSLSLSLSPSNGPSLLPVTSPLSPSVSPGSNAFKKPPVEGVISFLNA